MLRLFICKNCKFYFPAMGDNEINCPKCKNLSIPTEYFMVDLLNNTAKTTREIYEKYGVEYEEFKDMMKRIDEEERLRRSLKYKILKLFRSIRKFFTRYQKSLKNYLHIKNKGRFSALYFLFKCFHRLF